MADITSAASVDFDDEKLDDIFVGTPSHDVDAQHTIELSGLDSSWNILEFEKQKTVESNAERVSFPAEVPEMEDEEEKKPLVWNVSTTTTPIESAGIDITMLNSLNVAVDGNEMDLTMLNSRSISHNYSTAQ